MNILIINLMNSSFLLSDSEVDLIAERQEEVLKTFLKSRGLNRDYIFETNYKLTYFKQVE